MFFLFVFFSRHEAGAKGTANCKHVTVDSFVLTSPMSVRYSGDLSVKSPCGPLIHGIADETFDYSLLITRVRVLPTLVLAPHGTPVVPFSY